MAADSISSLPAFPRPVPQAFNFVGGTSMQRMPRSKRSSATVALERRSSYLAPPGIPIDDPIRLPSLPSSLAAPMQKDPVVDRVLRAALGTTAS